MKNAGRVRAYHDPGAYLAQVRCLLEQRDIDARAAQGESRCESSDSAAYNDRVHENSPATWTGSAGKEYIATIMAVALGFPSSMRSSPRQTRAPMKWPANNRRPSERLAKYRTLASSGPRSQTSAKPNSRTRLARAAGSKKVRNGSP